MSAAAFLLVALGFLLGAAVTFVVLLIERRRADARELERILAMFPVATDEAER